MHRHGQTWSLSGSVLVCRGVCMCVCTCAHMCPHSTWEWCVGQCLSVLVSLCEDEGGWACIWVTMAGPRTCIYGPMEVFMPMTQLRWRMMGEQLIPSVGMSWFTEVGSGGLGRKGLLCLEESGRAAWRKGHLLHGTFLLSLSCARLEPECVETPIATQSYLVCRPQSSLR